MADKISMIAAMALGVLVAGCHASRNRGTSPLDANAAVLDAIRDAETLDANGREIENQIRRADAVRKLVGAKLSVPWSVRESRMLDGEPRYFAMQFELSLETDMAVTSEVREKTYPFRPYESSRPAMIVVDLNVLTADANLALLRAGTRVILPLVIDQFHAGHPLSRAKNNAGDATGTLEAQIVGTWRTVP